MWIFTRLFNEANYIISITLSLFWNKHLPPRSFKSNNTSKFFKQVSSIPTNMCSPRLSIKQVVERWLKFMKMACSVIHIGVIVVVNWLLNLKRNECDSGNNNILFIVTEITFEWERDLKNEIRIRNNFLSFVSLSLSFSLKKYFQVWECLWIYYTLYK